MADDKPLGASTFRALFLTAPDAMIVSDAAGVIVLCNPQAEMLFGYEPGALEGLKIEMLVPQRIRGVHEGYRGNYIRDPRVRPMGKGQELSGLRRDGAEFPAEIGLSPIESEDGKFYAVSIRDISETQRARQALIRARYDTAIAQLSRLALESLGYETLLASIPTLLSRELMVDTVAMLLTETQGRTFQLRASVGLDNAFQRLVSFVVSADCFPSVLRCGDTFVASIDELAGGRSADVRRLLRESGRDDLVVAPLFDRDHPMGVLIAAVKAPNLFDRDKIHFLRSVCNLLAATLQRSRTEDQLAHAQRLEAIGQLTGGIAHDFNNLLTVISGNLQLLEGELQGSAQAQETVAAALRATGRGAELTKKLLAFARRQRLNPQVVDTGRLVDELGPLLRRSLGETVKVHVDCAKGVQHVFADPGELEGAILNLAINARDAMPQGGDLYVTLRDYRVAESEAHSGLRAGDYIAIEVRDTGVGMSFEVLTRAFEPFFTTKDSGRGSGLGLSMVYGFVKQSGGHVAADSRVGYGTKIEIFLPVAERGATTAERAMGAVQPRGSGTILVVEDEADVRRIAVSFLKAAGYATREAENAEQALAVLDANSDIDMLFSDVVLGGGMNGAECASIAQARQPQLHVLLTSGYENPTAHAAANIDPATRLLRKPYRREELLLAVREVLAS
ncbi:MAG: PAS domain S-box protein [Rudaea sp.]